MIDTVLLPPVAFYRGKSCIEVVTCLTENRGTVTFTFFCYILYPFANTFITARCFPYCFELAFGAEYKAFRLERKYMSFLFMAE